MKLSTVRLSRSARLYVGMIIETNGRGDCFTAAASCKRADDFAESRRELLRSPPSSVLAPTFREICAK